MKIKITLENASKIDALLLEENGKAGVYCITKFSDIEYVADSFRVALSGIKISRSFWSGAKYVFTSGGKVSRSYRYVRDVTRVTLTWFGDDVFLTDIYCLAISHSHSAHGNLFLTMAQEAEAIKVLKKSYILLYEEQKI